MRWTVVLYGGVGIDVKGIVGDGGRMEGGDFEKVILRHILDAQPRVGAFGQK
jgi:hypothetical protein